MALRDCLQTVDIKIILKKLILCRQFCDFRRNFTFNWVFKFSPFIAATSQNDRNVSLGAIIVQAWWKCHQLRSDDGAQVLIQRILIFTIGAIFMMTVFTNSRRKGWKVDWCLMWLDLLNFGDFVCAVCLYFRRTPCFQYSLNDGRWYDFCCHYADCLRIK